MLLSEKIIMIRRMNNLTQENFAEELGVICKQDLLEGNIRLHRFDDRSFSFDVLCHALSSLKTMSHWDSPNDSLMSIFVIPQTAHRMHRGQRPSRNRRDP